MIRSFHLALCLVLLASAAASAQDPNAGTLPSTNFATLGRPTIPTVVGGRVIDRVGNWLDGYPCCGYGKVNTDLGVPGLRSHYSFYWGSGCEFFREECRRPEASPYSQRSRSDLYGSGGCKTCGK